MTRTFDYLISTIDTSVTLTMIGEQQKTKSWVLVTTKVLRLIMSVLEEDITNDPPIPSLPQINLIQHE